MSEPELRVALVTGANRGIGYEVVRRLARANVTVILGSRDAGRGRQAVERLAAQGNTVRACQLDIADPASIGACTAALEREFGRLDILVNNAGAGFFARPPSALRVDELRAVFDTNFFGTFSMIRSLLPMLQRSKAGRIVNVSSGTASLFVQSNPQWIGYGMAYSAYCVSKTALNALTVQIAAELRSTPIKVNAVDPGFTLTDMTAELHRMGGLSAEEASEVVFRYAVLGPQGPTGGFYDRLGPVPW